jgi:hypothetical protein
VTPDSLAGYRSARQAQDERFDSRPGGGAVDHTMTDTDEYRAYFGVGEFAGGGVEERITFRSWLVAQARERRAAEADEPAPVPVGPEWWVSPEAAFYLPGDVLVDLAADGDGNAGAEIARRKVKRAKRRATAA